MSGGASSLAPPATVYLAAANYARVMEDLRRDVERIGGLCADLASVRTVAGDFLRVLATDTFGANATLNNGPEAAHEVVVKVGRYLDQVDLTRTAVSDVVEVLQRITEAGDVLVKHATGAYDHLGARLVPRVLGFYFMKLKVQDVDVRPFTTWWLTKQFGLASEVVALAGAPK